MVESAWPLPPTCAESFKVASVQVAEDNPTCTRPSACSLAQLSLLAGRRQNHGSTCLSSPSDTAFITDTPHLQTTDM